MVERHPLSLTLKSHFHRHIRRRQSPLGVNAVPHPRLGETDLFEGSLVDVLLRTGACA